MTNEIHFGKQRRRRKENQLNLYQTRAVVYQMEAVVANQRLISFTKRTTVLQVIAALVVESPFTAK